MIAGASFAQALPQQNSAPQFDGDISTQAIPAGKVVVVPVTASDADGDAIQYSVSSSNPHIMARVKTGNPSLQMEVSYAGDPNSTSPGAVAFSGTLTFQLFRDLVPQTTGIIGGLAQGGFYDGLLFHRIISLSGTSTPSTIIVQGGDPVGDGSGGPGFSFDNEFHPGLIFTGKGQLAMANSGFDRTTFGGTNGSQFFITNGTQRHLDFKHTIFAELMRGYAVLDKLAVVPQITGTTAAHIPTGEPTVKPVITAARVVPNHTDAVIYLSANATGTATITVHIWDGKTFAADGRSPQYTTKTFGASGVDDAVNDPPFLVPTTDVVTPVNHPISLGFKGVDLESDYLVFDHQRLSDSLITPALVPEDLVNLSTLTGKLKKANPDPVSGFLWAKFSPQNQMIVSSTTSTPVQIKTALLASLNPIISGTSIYDATRFAAVALSVPTRTLQAENPQGADLARLNRLLLGDAYPTSILTELNVDLIGRNPLTVLPLNNFDRPFDFAANVSQLGENPNDFGTVRVGIGDRRISGEAVTVAAKPGMALTNVVIASLSDTDLQSAASNFTATVNWGDGTPVVTGSGVALTSGSINFRARPAAKVFQVSASHTYAREGTYPLHVVLSDTNGATATAMSTALVSSSALVAKGATIASAGIVRGAVATFAETGGSVLPADYSASIDWGDGSHAKGLIVANRTGGFSVIGSHRYLDPEAFSVCITIADKNTHTATVWSTVQVRNSAVSHLPPFAQVNLVGGWQSDLTASVSGSGASMQQYISGSLIVLNSGAKTSAPSSIKLFLSPDQNLSTDGANPDTLLHPVRGSSQNALVIFPLKQGYANTYHFHPAGPPVAPQISNVPQPDTRIPLPRGVDGRGKYIIVQMEYSDPLTSHQAVNTVFIGGPIF